MVELIITHNSVSCLTIMAIATNGANESIPLLSASHLKGHQHLETY